MQVARDGVTVPRSGRTQGLANPEIISYPKALPQHVQRMREDILKAARSGEVEALRPVLESNELMPRVVSGDTGDPIAFWKKNSEDGAGREILAVLVTILQMPCARTDPGGPDETFIWPYLAELDLEQLTPAQEVDLYRVIPPAGVESMRDFGRYTGYRLGIGRDGTWHYFMAGQP